LSEAGFELRLEQVEWWRERK